ncbi:MAG TPA: hypothetical protein VGD88_05995 [Opitutaceae bacterium]
MHYLVHDSTGKILTTGFNPHVGQRPPAVPEGCSLVKGLAARLEDHEVVMVKGKPQIRELSAEKREARLKELRPGRPQQAQPLSIDQLVRALAKKGITLAEEDFAEPAPKTPAGRQGA